MEELLLDYEDFLRQHDLPLWSKDDQRALTVRKIGSRDNKSYKSYRIYIEEQSKEVAANTMICIIHQTNYLLDQLKRKLENDFLKEGGFTERLYQARKNYRERGKKN